MGQTYSFKKGSILDILDRKLNSWYKINGDMKKWDTETIGTSAANHAKCTRQLAQNARRNAKYLLNLQKANQSTAGIVTQNTDHHEDSNFRGFVRTYSVKLFLWLRL